MTARRHPWNPLRLAFAMLAGILSVGDAAKACSEVKVAKPCCQSRPAIGCGCCVLSASPPARPEASRDRVVAWSLSSTALGLDVGCSGGLSCECLASDPASPAQAPAARVFDEGRTDQGRGEVIAYLDDAVKPGAPARRLVLPNHGSPKTPLYLSMLHLLV